MRPKHLLALLLTAIPLMCFPQIEVNDSISFGQNKPEGISMEENRKPDNVSGIKHEATYYFTYAPTLNPLFQYQFAQPLDLQFTSDQTGLFHWNSGEIVVSGGTRAFPGLMQIDSGALGIYQSVGNFRFHAGGMVNKYGYFNGLHTQYGLNESITYQFTPRLSATVFGDYYFGQPPIVSNGMPMPPAMIGYYVRSTFGGYLDFQINERWGVQTGVQTVQQVGTNSYKAEPIVTPYYKISKKVAIGLPVGQILYHILKN